MTFLMDENCHVGLDDPIRNEFGPSSIKFTLDTCLMDTVRNSLRVHNLEFGISIISVDYRLQTKVKYLLQFRCVSKSWLKLLTTDSHFAKLNFDRLIESNCNPGILAKFTDTSVNLYLATEYTSCSKAIKLELPPFDPVTDPTSYRVNGICNGLLCMSDIYTRKVFIWNPLTKDHISISYSPTISQSPSLRSSTIFALGYHQHTNEYKVIKIVNGADFEILELHSHISVYTLGRDSSWRTLEEDMRSNLSGESGQLVNGVLHWLVRKTGSVYLSVILALDLKNELFHEILLPQELNLGLPKLFSPRIGELGGLLCLYCVQKLDQEVLQIWARKECGVLSSWTKQFKIRRTEVSASWSNLKLLSVVQNGEYVIVKNNEELILYNLKDNSIKNLEEFRFRFRDAYGYIGSIISPRLINATLQNMT